MSGDNNKLHEANYSLKDVTSIQDNYFSEEGVEGKDAAVIVLTPAHRFAGKKIKKTKKKNYNWQKTENRLNRYAEYSNVGLAIHVVFSFDIVTQFIPFFEYISGALSAFTSVADPGIYFFRALIRVTRLVGRHCFGITFDHEEKGKHKWQSHADFASLVLFSLSIPLFAGLIITSPVGITIAWAIAISGLAISLYFDYVSPAQFAKQFYLNKREELVAGKATQEDVDNALEDYEVKKVAKRLFAAVLFNVSILTLCTSALAFAPAMIVPVLKLAAQCASGLLVGLAVARYVNSKRAAFAKYFESVSSSLSAAAEWMNALFAKAEMTNELAPEANTTCDASNALSAEGKSANGKPLSPSVKIHLVVKDDSGLKKKTIILRENVAFVMEVATPKGKLNRNRFFADYVPAQAAPQASVISSKVGNSPRVL